MTLSLLSIYGILLSVSCFVLAIIVLHFGRQEVHKKWAIFNICVSVWGLGTFFVGNQQISSEEALFWWKFIHIPGSFIPVVFMHTILELCAVRKRKILWFFYLEAVFFIGLILIDRIGWELYKFDSF